MKPLRLQLLRVLMEIMLHWTGSVHSSRVRERQGVSTALSGLNARKENVENLTLLKLAQNLLVRYLRYDSTLVLW
jgi:hypothetical protein